MSIHGLNMLNIDLINEARHRIASRIHRTPVLTSRQFNEAAGKEVFFNTNPGRGLSPAVWFLALQPPPQ